LVIATIEFDDGAQGVRIAYGTSQKVGELRAGEFPITPADGAAYQLFGLSFPTKFDLSRTQDVPYEAEWFRVPHAPQYGHTPRLAARESLSSGKSRTRRGREEALRILITLFDEPPRS
jgi:hypothetical protein